MAKEKIEKTVIERCWTDNPLWRGGYQAFAKLFGRPLGWLSVLEDDGHKLFRVDLKGGISVLPKSKLAKPNCSRFLDKYLLQLKDNPEAVEDLPYTYRCAYGGWGVIFPLKRMGQLKGFFTLCDLRKTERQLKPFFVPFEEFLETHVELAYKSFELQNFYETVHPRALALSTIHSVHRVMASSIRLDDLIPRIGRLCAQVLKAQKCSVYLMDPTRTFLIPKFSFGDPNAKKRKIRVGFGIEGHVADTANFYFTRRCIAVPFIEDDVVGVVKLCEKIGNTPFTKTDLEILKTLSEQAVGAIKNAQLFEETEKITLGSIKTISELLALSYGAAGYVNLPIFGEIAYRTGEEMGLSGAELINLQRATYLIDAGQLAVPEHIFFKKAKLTKREYEQVKQHPYRGASILQQISSLKPLIPIILHHHERFDGRGYPNHLKGGEIPIGARIIAVVDSFMAMLSRRPYRRVKEINEAIREIQGNSGTQFDPKVVDAFMKVVGQPVIMDQLKNFSVKKKKTKFEILSP